MIAFADVSSLVVTVSQDFVMPAHQGSFAQTSLYSPMSEEIKQVFLGEVLTRQLLSDICDIKI